MPDPFCVVLGVTGVLPTANAYETQAISLCMVVAKKIILRMWKSDCTPTHEMWITELVNVLHLEKLRFSCNNKIQVFDKIWCPILKLIKRDDQ